MICYTNTVLKKYNLNNRKSIIKIIRYRSNLEACFARDLQEKKLTFDYEKTRLSFVPKIKHYTPDFYLVDYDFYIETKGLFIASDRAKHLLIKEQHPDLDIRFIFSRPTNKLDKRSKSTYGDWCDRYGFLYAKERIPAKWLKTTKTTT